MLDVTHCYIKYTHAINEFIQIICLTAYYSRVYSIALCSIRSLHNWYKFQARYLYPLSLEGDTLRPLMSSSWSLLSVSLWSLALDTTRPLPEMSLWLKKTIYTNGGRIWIIIDILTINYVILSNRIMVNPKEI